MRARVWKLLVNFPKWHLHLISHEYQIFAIWNGISSDRSVMRTTLLCYGVHTVRVTSTRVIYLLYAKPNEFFFFVVTNWVRGKKMIIYSRPENLSICVAHDRASAQRVRRNGMKTLFQVFLAPSSTNCGKSKENLWKIARACLCVRAFDRLHS